MTSALLLGLLLGVRHALDADHIAAVATIVTRTRSVRRGLLEGAAWGLGHTFTLLMLGTVVLLFGAGIRDDVANALEGCVGLMQVQLLTPVLTGKSGLCDLWDFVFVDVKPLKYLLVLCALLNLS